jgi:hypothetical protein
LPVQGHALQFTDMRQKAWHFLFRRNCRGLNYSIGGQAVPLAGVGWLRQQSKARSSQKQFENKFHETPSFVNINQN